MARDAGDSSAASRVVDRVAAEGIETIRLLFPDQHGILRGKTLTARALPSALANGIGMPSTLLLKDTSHRTVFPVWTEDVAVGDLPLAGASDVICLPDAESFRVLPWSPHSAVMLCDVLHRSGEPLEIAPRTVLRRAENLLAEAGYTALFGLEVEFQVFAVADDGLAHEQATMPPAAIQTRNTTQGYQFLTETRYAEVEDLLDDLRRNADALGLGPRTVEIEMGPSQFEFTFDPSGPLEQADRFVLFRTMVKEVCHRRGLHASFMPKPNLPNAAANGWHIHQSVLKDGRNALMPTAEGVLTDVASGWIAGLLEHAAASCLLTTPTVNGYKRFAPYQLAPNRIHWGTDNRGAMVRVLLYPGDTASRIENRVADSSANPYFAFAAQILSGLDGIERGTTAPPATEAAYDGDATALPATLIAAVEAFEASPLYLDRLGEGFVRYLSTIKRAEWDRYLSTVSEWEQAEYFNLF
ncbi:MAG: glutamine synthetase family protein [Paracoccaceae bacterium]